METVKNLCVDFGYWGKVFFAKVSFVFRRPFCVLLSIKTKPVAVILYNCHF